MDMSTGFLFSIGNAEKPHLSYHITTKASQILFETGLSETLVNKQVGTAPATPGLSNIHILCGHKLSDWQFDKS